MTSCIASAPQWWWEVCFFESSSPSFDYFVDTDISKKPFITRRTGICLESCKRIALSSRILVVTSSAATTWASSPSLCGHQRTCGKVGESESSSIRFIFIHNTWASIELLRAAATATQTKLTTRQWLLS